MIYQNGYFGTLCYPESEMVCIFEVLMELLILPANC